MLTLEEVCEAFEFWRANRRNRREAIPEKLWGMIRALMPHYNKSTLCKTLGVSNGQLNGHCKTFDLAAMPEDGFAVGAFGTEYLCNEVCELTLKGLHKSLQIKTNIRHVAHVLSLVERYL